MLASRDADKVHCLPDLEACRRFRGVEPAALRYSGRVTVLVSAFHRG